MKDSPDVRERAVIEPPKSDRVLNVEIVGRTLSEQFPELPLRKIERLGPGWEYEAYLIDDRLGVRFPRYADIGLGVEVDRNSSNGRGPPHIFPILMVLLIRRQPWTSAWLPRARLGTRVLVGAVLAGCAVMTYALLRDGADAPWILLGRIGRYENLDSAVQVFLEDVTIAILFVRLAGAVGPRWATVVVACLFAVGHVPAMLSQGATWLELAGLLRDAGLGVAVILVLQRSGDVVWFWCVHFCLDMTQFTRISGVA
jgi:hypothetical protein